MEVDEGRIFDEGSSSLNERFSTITQVADRWSPRVSKLRDYLTSRRCLSFSSSNIVNLARNHPPFLYSLSQVKNLPVHNGCVNTICWNETGEYILSGSDDRRLCITKPCSVFDKNYVVAHTIQTAHRGSIFCAQFMPNFHESQLVSCSCNGPVMVYDIWSRNPSKELFTFACQSSSIYEVVPIKDANSVFLSCSEDKSIRLFDLRCHKSCTTSSTCPHTALVRNSHAITTLAIHPFNTNIFIAGRADGSGLVYDRRKLPDPSKFSREKAHQERLADQAAGRAPTEFKFRHPLDGVITQFNVPELEKNYRFTSLCYSADGTQVLASYSKDYIYLFDNDANSNLELVQTLPKTQQPPPSEGRNSNRVSMIRVRGDWSDTGINSTPRSTRSDTILCSQATTRHITQMAHGLISARNNSGSYPVAEIIARPHPSGDVSQTELAPNASNEAQQVGQGAGGGGDGGGGYDSDDDDNDEDDDETNDDENNDDADENDENENEAETEEHDCEVDRGGNGRSESSSRIEVAESSRSQGQCNSKSCSDEGKKQSRVSEKTRAKFRTTFNDLKQKFQNIPSCHPRVKYQGHRNCRTSIKEAIFWGDDYIMSGSDCGRILVWEKNTAKLVMAFPADRRVVNCLAPNPYDFTLASSGIDYDIKLWSAHNKLGRAPEPSQEELESIVKNNQAMLEETRNTTVLPAHLFFRVISSYSNYLRANNLEMYVGLGNDSAN